jgi:uncharacterized protein YchJ
MHPVLTRTPAQPYHAGTQAAETPARLLRTRFSAYCKGKADYVIATTHPDNDQLRSVTREAFAADVAATAEKGRFSNLEILAESAGLASDQAIVAFRYIVRCLAHAFSQCLLTRVLRSLRSWGRRASARGPARDNR